MSNHYAAALDELAKTPLIELPKFMRFVSSVFDVSNDVLMSDLMEWTAIGANPWPAIRADGRDNPLSPDFKQAVA